MLEPGLRMLSGSKAALMRRFTAMASAPIALSSQGRLRRPMPCSPQTRAQARRELHDLVDRCQLTSCCRRVLVADDDRRGSAPGQDARHGTKLAGAPLPCAVQDVSQLVGAESSVSLPEASGEGLSPVARLIPNVTGQQGAGRTEFRAFGPADIARPNDVRHDECLEAQGQGRSAQADGAPICRNPFAPGRAGRRISRS